MRKYYTSSLLPHFKMSKFQEIQKFTSLQEHAFIKNAQIKCLI